MVVLVVLASLDIYPGNPSLQSQPETNNSHFPRAVSLSSTFIIPLSTARTVKSAVFRMEIFHTACTAVDWQTCVLAKQQKPTIKAFTPNLTGKLTYKQREFYNLVNQKNIMKIDTSY